MSRIPMSRFRLGAGFTDLVILLTILSIGFGLDDAQAGDTFDPAAGSTIEAGDRRAEAEARLALSQQLLGQGKEAEAGVQRDRGVLTIGETGPRILSAPFDVLRHFVPSGWMGDGAVEDGRYIRFSSLAGECDRPGDDDDVCIRIDYTPGPVGWAGIHWQYPEHNWGEVPGTKLENASRIVFWAKGIAGDEIVRFKAGGISSPGKPYNDSFELSLGTRRLATGWKEYQVDLPSGLDPSNVVAAFSWIAESGPNPEGVSFLLDAMTYQ